MIEIVFCSDKVYLWLLIVIIDINKYICNKNDIEILKNDWLKNNLFFFLVLFIMFKNLYLYKCSIIL